MNSSFDNVFSYAAKQKNKKITVTGFEKNLSSKSAIKRWRNCKTE